MGITAFRSSVERARIKEVQAINTELEDLTTTLDEQRVNDRTAELATANIRTSSRAAQLQAITELSEAIAQLQDLGELFNSAVNLISARFGFYHVGIFLIDNDSENAICKPPTAPADKRSWHAVIV